MAASVGIVGAGTMGAGIAQVALEAGWEVRLFDADPAAIARARERVANGLKRRAHRPPDRTVDRPDPAGEPLARLSVVDTMEATTDGCQLVIEAAIEDLEVKRSIFGRLDRAARADIILATNTSALSVSRIAEAARRPERVVGLHFFNPAPVLPLVEVVAGAHTASGVTERAATIVEGWGKTPIRSTDSPGFIVNRVNRPFTLEPLRMLHAGMSTVVDIDTAIEAAGFRMGPFRLMDLIGLDVNLAAARGLFEGFGHAPRFRPSPIQESLVADGHLGRKSGQGFYRYGSDGRSVGPAPRFQAVLAHLPGQETLDGVSIAERTILAIVNEAYRALGDRVAGADDIDRAMRLGANHPFGPFEWARRTGVTETAAMLDGLTDEDADTFRPALPLLREARSAG